MRRIGEKAHSEQLIAPGGITVMLGTFLLLAGVLLGLAGCGGLASAAARSGSSAATTPDRLLVTRPAGVLMDQPYPARTWLITASAKAQQIYAAALKQQHVPNGGVYNCPADFGLVYSLTFQHGSTVVQTMNLNATGCTFLKIGQNDLRWADTNFQTLLANEIGLSSLRQVRPYASTP